MILKNSFGDRIEVPREHRDELKKLMLGGCHECVDAYLEKMTLGGPPSLQTPRVGASFAQQNPFQRKPLYGEDPFQGYTPRAVTPQPAWDVPRVGASLPENPYVPASYFPALYAPFQEPQGDASQVQVGEAAPQDARAMGGPGDAFALLSMMGMANDKLERRDHLAQFQQAQVNSGMSDNKFLAQNAKNPFGNYTTNAGPGPNFQLNNYTPTQRRFEAGGEYELDEEEIRQILEQGGEVEYL